MLNAALIGFGGIAQAAHIPAYKSLEKKNKVRLVAAYEINKDRFNTKTEINIGGSDVGELKIRQYTNLEEMLNNEAIDLIDICIPTPFHSDMAVNMLDRGYNVFCEKPMSRTYNGCLKMLDAAKQSKGKLMIGQCLRFFPDYMYLKGVIDSGEFGKPLSAVFRRMSVPPIWGWQNWYMNYEMSGGALMDLHIHDIDMARYLFGEPYAVSCLAQDVYSKFDIAHSRLYYENLPVLAIGDWSLAGTPFTADFRVGFEKASVISEGGTVTVYTRDDKEFKPELVSTGGYEGEIEYFVNMINSKSENIKNPPESAALSLKLIETLRESAESGGKIVKFNPA